MKKVLSLLLALCLMTACSSQPAEEQKATETPSAPVSSTPTEQPAETPSAPAEEVSYPVIEMAEFDGSALAPAENETLRVAYPADLYTVAPDFSPLTLWLNETIDSEQSANINIQKSEAFPAKLNQAFLDEMLAAQKTVEGAEALTVNVAEIRELNGEPVIYMENITEINDEVIDLLLAEGILTEEMIEQSGGRETFKAIPPTKSVAIYAVVDGYLTMYTGTYYNDAHKDPLIDTMTILIANTEFLS